MKLFFHLFLIFLSSNAFAQTEYYVLFDSDKSEVPDTSMAALIKTIYSQKIGSIYLEGHCDSVGSKRYNYGLSKRRVKAVRQLLVDNGFDPKLIKGKVGFGKDRPLNKNINEEERQLNRRVLVKFETAIEAPPVIKKVVIEKKKIAYKATTEKTKPPIVKDTFIKESKAFTPTSFKKNNIIRIPNLLFPGGRHKFYPSSKPILDSLYNIMNNNPNLVVEIQGHVCCTTYHLDGFDWDTRTDNLSQNRARAVFSYLVSRGINYKRMRVKGYGGSRKINEDERTEELRKVNRRVDILVLEH